MQRLEAFIAPVKQLWQNPELDGALSSFNGFCELLGIGKVRNYLVSRRVHEVSDWSTMQLDDEGQAMQAELNERVKVTCSLQVLTRTRSTDCAL
jgi:exportin-5